MIKGLDDWITGKNDPHAPFNQTDWVEQYNNILDYCDWITDGMLEDDTTYMKLEKVLEEVLIKFLEPHQHHSYCDGEDYYWLSPKESSMIISEHAEEIAIKFKKKYETDNN